VFTLTDTVGFVRHLPHQLVEAFRSTLEEVADADLIVHVVDAAHPDPQAQLVAVREVFAEIGALGVPEIVAVNKADVADPTGLARLLRREPTAVVVSARTGRGLPELVERIAAALPRPDVDVDVLLPYDRGALVARVHAEGHVLAEEHLAQGTRLAARVSPGLAAALAPFGVAITG
jgi:GTP-binding protein HflX